MDDLAREVARWRRDPAHFARSVLGIDTLWRRQVEILEALRDHDRVAVPSCHESGKTFVASIAVVHHLMSYQPSKVVTTAPTQRQVRDLLWSEIRARHGDLARRLGGDVGLGEPTQLHWAIPEAPDWFATGFATSPDRANESATRMQGYHSPHLLVVLDEAAGVPREVWAAIDGLLTSDGAKVLAIGQPASGTEFERACRSSDWRVLPISAYDCPNVQAGRSVQPWGVTAAWVERMGRRWGEGSIVFLSKVLGQFAEHSDDTLISPSEVERAFARVPSEDHVSRVSIGCDVARFGSDETVIVVLRGGEILGVESFSGQDLMKTVGHVVRLARAHGLGENEAQRIAVDDTALGGGVTDRLRELGWRIKAINFGSRPERSRNADKLLNRRSELWWGLRQWIRADAALAALPVDQKDVLRGDLCAPRYGQRSDGRIALEPKKDIRRRLGKSPDWGDSLALAVEAGDRRAACGSAGKRSRTIRKTKYDLRDERDDPRVRPRRRHAVDGYGADDPGDFYGTLRGEW